jgi:anti-sigma factor RsiW
MPDTLTCEEFVELVTAFLDHALDERTEQRFIEHLADCPGCDIYFAQFRGTIEVLGTLPADTIPTDARDRLLSAFRDWHRS